MGADLYWEASNFRPRYKIYWENEKIVLEAQPVFGKPMKVYYRGPLDATAKKFIKAMGLSVPKKVVNDEKS